MTRGGLGVSQTVTNLIETDIKNSTIKVSVNEIEVLDMQEHKLDRYSSINDFYDDVSMFHKQPTTKLKKRFDESSEINDVYDDNATFNDDRTVFTTVTRVAHVKAKIDGKEREDLTSVKEIDSDA